MRPEATSVWGLKLLDVLHAQSNDDLGRNLTSRESEETLEFALKRIWNNCALNLFRQATSKEPPDQGILPVYQASSY